jgi:hypothetical protein
MVFESDDDEVQFTPEGSESFEDMMAAAFEEPPVLEKGRMSPKAQAAFYTIEALIQVVDALHMEHVTVPALGEEFPGYAELQANDALSYGAEHYDLQDPFQVLDYAAWLKSLIVPLGELVGAYLRDHDMAEHIHLWVRLPGIGFMPCLVSKEEGKRFLLALPAGLFDALEEGDLS